MDKIAKRIPWLVGLLAFGLLVAHTFNWKQIHVDAVTIFLLAVIGLAPLIEFVRKIKIGESEAEIASREVADASAKVQKVSPEKNKEQSAKEEEYPEILDIVRNDPPLGLAKLRMELERFLKILYAHSFPDKKQIRFIGLGKMIRELSRSEYIPANIVAGLEDVISLANRAVHGEYIRHKDAEELATIGVRLLDDLRYIYRERVVRPLETEVISVQKRDEYHTAKYKIKTVVPLVNDPT